MSHDSPAGSEAPRSARPNLLQLAVVLLSMFLLYAGLTWLFWMPPLLSRARVSIGTVTDRSVGGAVALALVGMALHALYAYGALLLWHGPVSRRTGWLIWLGAIATSALLLCIYPVTSTDLFDYLFRARMAVEYAANPYLALPNQFKSDPYLRYIGWPNAPSAYGPLWEIASRILYLLGGGSFGLILVLYKLLAIVAYLGCGVAISSTIRDPRRKLLGAYLWLWSPLALWEFAGIGHNDGLMILSLLLAVWATRRDREWLAVLGLAAGALIKFLPAIFVPLVVLHWMRRQPTWSRRGLVCCLALALCCIPAILLYAPYWDLPASFAQLGAGEKLGAIWQGRTGTLRNMSVREGFLNASPLAVLSYLLQSPSSLGWINRLLTSLALPAASDKAVRAAVSSLATTLLAVGLLWQSWQVWFKGRTLQAAFFGLLLWYVLCGSQWFQPWYVLWLLAIFALQPTRETFGWLTAWAMMAQSSYLLQYIILPNLKLSGQTLQAQVYYLLLIYPIPLLVWLLTRYGPFRRNRQPSRIRRPLAPARPSQ